jgi:hypothetical protein
VARDAQMANRRIRRLTAATGCDQRRILGDPHIGSSTLTFSESRRTGQVVFALDACSLDSRGIVRRRVIVGTMGDIEHISPIAPFPHQRALFALLAFIQRNSNIGSGNDQSPLRSKANDSTRQCGTPSGRQYRAVSLMEVEIRPAFARS